MTKEIRVLLLERSDIDAEAVRRELDRAGLNVVVERVESEEAFRLALKQLEPDVILSDHVGPNFSPLAALDIVLELLPSSPFILLGESMDEQVAVACLKRGAEDFIRLSRSTRLAGSIEGALEIRKPLRKLTPRQLEVLRLVSDGHTTREIARQLQLSVKTVETHRGEIMKRLGIHDVVGLVRYAVRVGLVPSDAS